MANHVYFIAHRISNPITGGELYNEQLLAGAEKAGYIVHRWEGQKYGRLKYHIVIMNCIYLFKALSIKRKSIVMLDMDFHARYIFALLWAKYFRKCRIAGMLHNYNFSDKKNPFMRSLHFHIEGFVSRHLQALVTNSRFSANAFKSFSRKQIPIYTHPPFIRRTEGLDRAHFNPSKTVLLSVGNIEPRKNMLAVCKALSSVQSDFQFNIIGSPVHGGYLKEITDYIKASGLTGRAFYRGRIQGDDLAKWYSQSTVFVLVSEMETFGIVYGEAMGFGLPIIGSARAAVPELVEDGVNGFLCDPDDIKGIAAAIDKLHNREVWERISRANLRKYESLMDRDQFLKRSTEIFQRIGSL